MVQKVVFGSHVSLQYFFLLLLLTKVVCLKRVRWMIDNPVNDTVSSLGIYLASIR